MTSHAIGPKRPRGRPRKVGYDETDMRIGIGRGLGLSNEDVAKLADCAEQTIQRRKDEPFPKLVAAIVQEASARFRADTVEDVKKQFERRFGKAFGAVDRALEAVKVDGTDDYSAQLRASEVIFDRALGKPTTKAEINAHQTNVNILAIPEETITRLNYITARLAPAQIAGAVEAEVVEETEA